MNRQTKVQHHAIPLREAGFGLVELMVAAAMGLLLTLGVINLFVGSKDISRTQKMLAEVQENGRFALSLLMRDGRMAGNTARTYTRSPIKKTVVGAMQPDINNNCFTTSTQAMDWALAALPTALGDPTPMIFGEDNITDTTVFSGCISATNVQAGTDILSIHYVDSNAVDSSDLTNDNIYFNSGLGGAVIFKCSADGTTCLTNLTDQRSDPTGSDIFHLRSRAYYIRNWSESSGDEIPTLVRAELQADGEVTTEPLVSGVVSLQVTYGVDTDNDGIADRYYKASELPALSSSSGLTSDWVKIKTVRVGLLVQSTEMSGSRDPADVTYSVNGTDVTLSGKYLSKVFSATIAVRNPSARTAN